MAGIQPFRLPGRIRRRHLIVLNCQFARCIARARAASGRQGQTTSPVWPLAVFFRPLPTGVASFLVNNRNAKRDARVVA